MLGRVCLTIPVVAAVALVAHGGCGGVDHAPEGPARITGCPDPMMIVQAGTDAPSGFVRCADGLVHRETVESCLEPYIPGDCVQPPGTVNGNCTTDASCDLAPYGACFTMAFGCWCRYGCATDADCGGGVCVCAGVAGSSPRCAPANCSSTAECGDGLCALESGEDPCRRPESRVACLGDEAPCRTDADCEAEKSGYCPEGDPSKECRFVDEEWSCHQALHCNGPCG